MSRSQEDNSKRLFLTGRCGTRRLPVTELLAALFHDIDAARLAGRKGCSPDERRHASLSLGRPQRLSLKPPEASFCAKTVLFIALSLRRRGLRLGESVQ